MKAAIRRTYGAPAVISVEQMEDPIVKNNEVLIKLQATTVNRTDCANLTAKPFIMHFVLGLFKPRKIIIGTDFAGEVIAKGKDVDQFAPGDRVFGFKDTGAQSQATHASLHDNLVFPIPENIGYKEAAASLEGAHYAYTFVQKTNIQKGQRVLINGATGAIGSALLQFVRLHDVHITATCNAENKVLIKALGADQVIDYSQEDFTQTSNRYDFIFDTVGKSTFGKCKPILTEKGIYISSELGPYSQNVVLPLITSMTKKKVIFPVPYNPTETVPFIMQHLKTGSFKPVIDREYTLQDIAKAYTYVMTGQKTGNVVLTMPSENKQS